ncbi:MAG: class I SAM-dependent methyltransferase, partial [Deltaproteobacteria bacterium]|nr:class I SAM-dependent methyltransferase [Deltaproteobacteria bacterium]
MTENFYKAFEDKHRGSRDDVKDKQRIYLQFAEAIKEVYPCQVGSVDLGCGRGEWLELLAEVDLTCHGVDLDEGMLAECLQRGLSVEQGEAVAYLKSLPDDSQLLVSGFHIAEHLPFSALQGLVQQALRVLKPAGLLILETPNPENIVVGTDSFYLDPTHEKPIPLHLLAFLPEHYGFYRTKILRLQEAEGIMGGEKLSLFEVLGGVSPDYGIVAQKTGDPNCLNRFDTLFQRDYGVSLESLAMKYDADNQQSLLSTVRLTEQAVEQTEKTLALQQQQMAVIEQQRQEESRSRQQEIHRFQHELNHSQEQTAAAEQQTAAAEQQTAAAEEQAYQLGQQLQQVYTSRSWRVTRPLRGIGQIGRWLLFLGRKSIK